jgi:hypothetical protein
MISCNLAGGLGNYMFQIGAMYSLSPNVGFNIENVIQVHKNIKTYLTNIFRNVNFSISELQYQYNEVEFNYNKLPNKDGMLFNGYFQSEKYLDRDKILDLYSIDKDTMNYINLKYKKFFSNSVSIHVRRGDYLDKKDRHPIQDINYYNLAMTYFNNYENFIIFSDDIEWCKNNFMGDKFMFIEGEKDYIDLWLMSLCTHNIIANSSFSWWGAWLNKNSNKKVIAPSNWFGENKKLNTKDLYCKDWIVI